MANEKSSTVTSSMNVANPPASRTPIGRPPIGALATAVPVGRLTIEQARDEIASGMAVQQPSEIPIAIKDVDSRTIQGSHPGDHRQPTRDGVTDSLRLASGSD